MTNENRDKIISRIANMGRGSAPAGGVTSIGSAG